MTTTWTTFTGLACVLALTGCLGHSFTAARDSGLSEKTAVTFRGIRPADPNGSQALRNPERGLRLEIGAGHIDTDRIKYGAAAEQWPFKKFASDGVTVGQAYCYLTQFYNTPVSQEKLAAIQRDFDHLRNLGNGSKFLLRFAYEFDGVTNGPTAEQICGHMKQLKPVLDRNWDVIYALQIGWVGLWGEFHTSVQKTEKDPAKTALIVQGTLDLLPPDRFTMMRRMAYKSTALKQLGRMEEVTAATAFSQSPAAKIGFFNDGTLANGSDGGTFPTPPYFSAIGNPEFAYLVREAPFIPVDGELFWSSQVTKDSALNAKLPFHGLDLTYSSATQAIERLRLHHYSTFSYVHGFSGLEKPVYGVIDSWKETVLTPDELSAGKFPFSPDYFCGAPRTAFEYIRDHLGYRLEAQRAAFSAKASPGKMFDVEIDIINRGFATMINPRAFFFALVNPDGAMVEIPTGFDGRSLQPYQPGDPGYAPLTHTVKAATRLPADMPPGEWALALWMPDPRAAIRLRSDYAVRLANPVEWLDVAGHGMNKIGTVTVR